MSGRRAKAKRKVVDRGASAKPEHLDEAAPGEEVAPDRATLREFIIFACGVLSLTAAALLPTIFVRTCLVALSLAFVVAYVWHTTWWTRLSMFKRGAGLTVLVVGFALLVVLFVPGLWRAEQAVKLEGVLDSPLSDNVSDTVLVDIGGSPVGIYWGGNGKLSALFRVYGGHGDGIRLDDDTAIRIGRGANGAVYISTTVRDARGNVIVELQNNHWRVSPDSSVSWDHNYTANVLEVLDGRRHVVFQVGIFPDHVRLAGIWHTSKGVVSLGDEWCHDKVQTSCVAFSLKAFPRDDLIIPTVFTYPSIDHWGETRSAPYRMD